MDHDQLNSRVISARNRLAVSMRHGNRLLADQAYLDLEVAKLERSIALLPPTVPPGIRVRLAQRLIKGEQHE